MTDAPKTPNRVTVTRVPNVDPPPVVLVIDHARPPAGAGAAAAYRARRVAQPNYDALGLSDPEGRN